ncbi:hypothetical protein PHMEG_00029609, partial [Phytophthora megakarya]
TPRGDRPISPPPDQDQPEIEGPEGEELEDKCEIPDGVSTDEDSPGGSPGGGSPLQLNPQLFPAEESIPRHSMVNLFTAAEITPWDPFIMGSVPIIAMIPSTLTKRSPTPPGYRSGVYTRDYHSELITGANVIALMVTTPWLVLRRNRPTPLTFDPNLHLRASTPLRRIAEAHLIAYWESTHYLEITKATLAADLDLFVYRQNRRQRRIRVGDRWRKLLGACLPMMKCQWAHIDLLLDPYFLHLPTP